MYTSSQISTILIVKTSSLGDIIQAMPVLDELHRRFPTARMDWVVEKDCSSLVQAHPLIGKTIEMDLRGLKSSWSSWKQIKHQIGVLRETNYDLIFDLQGNTKSGLVTFLARGAKKIGFGRRSVREWPNLFATHLHFEVPLTLNIRQQHRELLNQFFQDTSPLETPGFRFTIKEEEQKFLEPWPSRPLKVMVCPSSKWTNKQLPLTTWVLLLSSIQQTLNASFLFVWGTESEKAFCETLQSHLDASIVVDRLTFPVWQNLMSTMDLIIAVDSVALHLAGTTQTPTFSVFGPTNASVFRPMGQRHFSIQGECPYKRNFEKNMP